MQSIFALSDDLSGAAETAAVFAGTVPSPRVQLDLRAIPSGPGVVVIDTDSRHAGADSAADTITALLDRIAPTDLVFKKVDSLVRGNVAAELGAIARVFPVLFCPALPVLGRTVVGGRPLVRGVNLADTGLWHAEHTEAPRSLVDLFPGMPTAILPLDVVRGDFADLVAALRRVALSESSPFPVVIADAENAQDLDALVAAAAGDGTHRVALAGSSALARAVAGSEPVTPVAPAVRRLVVVVGTASSEARAQVVRLREQGIPVVELDVDSVLAGGALFDDAFDGGALPDVFAVTMAPGSRIEPGRASAVAAALATRMAALAAGDDGASNRALVLTGGETARRVLDALGVGSLDVVGEIEHGAVQLITADGRTIVTRPGSFGDADSLVDIVGHLTSPQPAGTDSRKGRR